METKAAILQLLKTLNGIVDTMIGLQIDCRTGFKHNKSKIEEGQVHSLTTLQKENPSATTEDVDRLPIFFGRTDPNVPDAQFQHVATMGQYKGRNSENGINTILLDRSIIVTLYSYWEELFRPTIAATAKVKKNKIQADIFGDLRILRNCIIHGIGVCDDSITKTKLLRWFSRFDEIILTEQMMDTIFIEVKNAITSLAKELTGEDVVYLYERSLQPG